VLKQNRQSNKYIERIYFESKGERIYVKAMKSEMSILVSTAKTEEGNGC
jgi:DNA polymerase III sliding clamp (beta) subunit (PCNA family)